MPFIFALDGKVLGTVRPHVNSQLYPPVVIILVYSHGHWCYGASQCRTTPLVSPKSLEREIKTLFVILALRRVQSLFDQNF